MTAWLVYDEQRQRYVDFVEAEELVQQYKHQRQQQQQQTADASVSGSARPESSSTGGKCQAAAVAVAGVMGCSQGRQQQTAAQQQSSSAAAALGARPQHRLGSSEGHIQNLCVCGGGEGWLLVADVGRECASVRYGFHVCVGIPAGTFVFEGPSDKRCSGLLSWLAICGPET